MTYINEKFRYILTEEAAIQDFDDGSLVFLCEKLQLIHINKTAKKILELMNGQRSLKQIINITSRDYTIRTKDAKNDILQLVHEMGLKGVVKPLVKFIKQGSQKMDDKSHFMGNPDVSLREENGEGALLFNADTDALLIINPVGLIIWNFVRAHPRTRQDVIKHIKEECDDVPSEQLEADIDEFLKDLHTKGFIGEVVDERIKR